MARKNKRKNNRQNNKQKEQRKQPRVKQYLTEITELGKYVPTLEFEKLKCPACRKGKVIILLDELPMVLDCTNEECWGPVINELLEKYG